MPDRWGRITHNDWNAMTGMINQFQAMGQRNQQYARQKAEWDRIDKTRGDTVTAYNAAMNPQQIPDPQNHVDSAVYGAPVPKKNQPLKQALGGLSPEGVERGLNLAQNVMSFQEKISGMQDTEKMNAAANIFLEKGTIDPRQLPEEFRGNQATVAAAQSLAASIYSKSQAAKEGFVKTRMADINHSLELLRAGQQRVVEADKAGDKASVGQMVEDLSEHLPVPYKYVYDEKTDSFKELYLHSGTGQFEDNGTRIPYKEAVQKLTTMQPKEFATAAYMHKEAIRQWNELARLPAGTVGADGNEIGRGQWITKNGQRFYVFPQKPNSDTSRVAYIVMDKDNNQVEYPNIQALLNAGYRYEDLKREKGLLDVANKQERNRQQVMGGGPGNQVDYDHLKQVITEGAKFFGQEGQVIDANGNLTTAGENTRVEALDFYNKHKNTPAALTGVDAQKFQIAKAITAATEQYFGFQGQQPGNQIDAVVAEVKTLPPQQLKERLKALGKQSPELYKDVMVRLRAEKQGAPGNSVDIQNPSPGDTAGAPAAQPGETGAVQPQIRSELPQDMSQWNFQVISQNGRQVPVVITDRGPIQLTPEEVEMYRQLSAQQKRGAIGSAIGSGVEWFKNNATGTQQIRR